MSVSRTISNNETMMDGDLDRYVAVGADAMHAIHHAVGEIRPKAVLDLPCGHGRVARHLRASYADADLFVVDLDSPGAAFCAAEFDAIQLPASTDFQKLQYDNCFDLIWVGSLITHLDSATTLDFLSFCARHLTATGSAVVTSHGAFVAGRLLLSDTSKYGLDPTIEAKILAQYLDEGYGYHDYPEQPGYGISLISRDWMTDAAASVGLRIESFQDHGWDNHQDVIALQLQ